jgi:hypothetical protein
MRSHRILARCGRSFRIALPIRASCVLVQQGGRMKVKQRGPGDRRKLGRMVEAEREAIQRDRLRCVGLALDRYETLDIAATLGRRCRFVPRWVHAHRIRGRCRAWRDGSRPRPTPDASAGSTIRRAGATRCDARGRRVLAPGRHMRRILSGEAPTPPCKPEPSEAGLRWGSVTASQTFPEDSGFDVQGRNRCRFTSWRGAKVGCSRTTPRPWLAA